MKAIVVAAGLSVLILLGVACTGDSLESSEATATNEVAVKDNKFDAQVVEVSAGTTVTWTWVGDRPHNVTGDNWASDNLSEGSFERTFDVAGTYDYRCTLHGGMTGRVIVTP